MEIIIEILLLFILGIGGTYLVWILKGRKESFWAFANQYAYSIAYLVLALIGLGIAFFRTYTN